MSSVISAGDPNPVRPRAEVAAALLAEALAADVVSPSVTAAVFDRTGVLSARSRGEAQVGGTQASPDTVYRIASMSKSFCAAAVLLLAERGQLAPDDELSRHLPQFSDLRDGSGERWPVTLRMLLTNSSGLPEDNAWADEQLGISRADLLGLLTAGVRFGDLPGVGYQYSNLGFGLLALVVENVTGQRFTEFVECELLAPLGLRHTHYAQQDYPAAEHLACGYSTVDDGTSWNARPFVADGALASAGGLFSTVADIAAWSGWLSGAFAATTGTDGGVMSARSRRLMQTMATPIGSDSRLDVPSLLGAGYGMGLVIEFDRERGVVAQHSGGLPGFSSHMRWHTDSGLGVVVLANAGGASLSGWARALHGDLLQEFRLPAKRVAVWPRTLLAARAVDEMLLGGADFATCAELFCGNVATDLPLELRRSRAAELIGRLGGAADEPGAVEDRLLWAPAGSALTWRLPCRQGDAVVSIELTPWRDSRVQRVTVEPWETAGDPPGMLGRFVPTITQFGDAR